MSTAWVWIRSVAIYGIIGFVYLGLSITMIVLANMDRNNEHYHCKLDQLPLVGFFYKVKLRKSPLHCVHFGKTKKKSSNDKYFHSK